MHRFGLLGYPLSHSFSQKYFTEKFAQLGLTDYVYENYSFADISDMKKVIDTSEDLCGFNITIPHKKAVIPFLDNMTDVVKQIGACNCVSIQNGKLTGHNTDVFGFEQSLLPFLKPQHTKALILGTGGASAAVEFVLQNRGIEVKYVSREKKGTVIGYDELDDAMMGSYHLLVNCTPLGMYPNVDACPDIPYQFLSSQHHLYDLIYNPAESKFLEKGRLQGATTQNGQEMLILQAEESWRIWNA